MAYYEDIAIKDFKLMCNLCKKLFPQNDDKIIEFHLNDKNHIDLYKHRTMVQNNIIIRENHTLCGLCKENVLDIRAHIQSKKHKDIMSLINKLIEKDGAFLELPHNIQKRTEVHCTICDHSIEFTLEFVREHINGLRHRRARAMAVQPFNGIFSVEGSDDDLWCKICQIYFENYIETIFEHVDDNKEHNIRLTKILRLIEGQNIFIDAYLTNPTEDRATCNKCNTGVACNVDNLERHIKGKRHRS
ncbi:uncharacterized protein [Maniola hyperantus]|uniref:uncharacterized protein n=1 Tax=Aphantopus hyperantus TaxID=2795564 RepID=UPI00213680AD